MIVSTGTSDNSCCFFGGFACLHDVSAGASITDILLMNLYLDFRLH
jgi:hypothetical protein